MMRKTLAMAAAVAGLTACAEVVYPTAADQQTKFDGKSDQSVFASLKGKVDAENGAYLRFTYKACATAEMRLQKCASRKGGEKINSTYDIVYKQDKPADYDRVFFLNPGADEVEVQFQSMLTAEGLKVETATWQDACAYSDRIWKEVNRGDVLKKVLAAHPLPEDPLALLPRFRKALTDGKLFKVHFLGDSISQDSYFSLFQALVKREFPKSNLRFTIYHEGSTGCSVYRDKYDKAVAAFEPDLLVICGLDNFRGNGFRGDADAAAALGSVIDQARKAGCEVLYVSPAHSADSRILKDPNQLWGKLPWGEACAPFDYDPSADFWAKDCWKPAARNAVLAEKKVQCWDVFPQCYDFQAKSGRPWGWFSRDALHNNERGKAMIARIMLEYLLRR